MRAGLLLVVTAACSANIAPDTYFCGPEGLCPEGLECNGFDNICTVPSAVEPFACVTQDGVPLPDRTDDDEPAIGLNISNAGSCAMNRELRACLFENDPGDWFQFDLDAMCGTSFKLTGRLTFAIAFEPVAVQIVVDDGAPTAIDVECEQTNDDVGQTQRCFDFPLTGGSHYAVGLVHSAIANCDGACSHNRYLVDLRLENQ